MSVSEISNIGHSSFEMKQLWYQFTFLSCLSNILLVRSTQSYIRRAFCCCSSGIFETYGQVLGELVSLF
jgi:hypothetical protein